MASVSFGEWSLFANGKHCISRVSSLDDMLMLANKTLINVKEIAFMTHVILPQYFYNIHAKTCPSTLIALSSVDPQAVGY